jgi:hypothetical protein
MTIRSDTELIDAIQKLKLNVIFEEGTGNVEIDKDGEVLPIIINSEWRSAVNEALDILEKEEQQEAEDIFDVDQDGDMGEETR